MNNKDREVYNRGHVNCQKWTEEDIQLLQHAHDVLRGNWIRISDKYFPNRNPNQLKCKFQYLKTKEADVYNTQALHLIVFD